MVDELGLKVKQIIFDKVIEFGMKVVLILMDYYFLMSSDDLKKLFVQEEDYFVRFGWDYFFVLVKIVYENFMLFIDEVCEEFNVQVEVFKL